MTTAKKSKEKEISKIHFFCLNQSITTMQLNKLLNAIQLCQWVLNFSVFCQGEVLHFGKKLATSKESNFP